LCWFVCGCFVCWCVCCCCCCLLKVGSTSPLRISHGAGRCTSSCATGADEWVAPVARWPRQSLMLPAGAFRVYVHTYLPTYLYIYTYVCIDMHIYIC
jgi:hypothetical protein